MSEPKTKKRKRVLPRIDCPRCHNPKFLAIGETTVGRPAFQCADSGCAHVWASKRRDGAPYLDFAENHKDWVSVEERLPINGRPVLVYYNECGEMSVASYDVELGGWFSKAPFPSRSIYAWKSAPKFWRPLPLPPEE